MAILKPRTKIITFRVAEEEFEQLKNLSAAGGARSLSEPLRKQPDQRFSHSPLEGGYEGPPRAERSDSSRRLAFHSFIPQAPAPPRR